MRMGGKTMTTAVSFKVHINDKCSSFLSFIFLGLMKLVRKKVFLVVCFPQLLLSSSMIELCFSCKQVMEKICLLTQFNPVDRC